MKRTSVIFVLLILLKAGYSQDSTAKIPVKYLDQVTEKAKSVSDKLDLKSERVLRAFEKQEEKIYRRLLKKDSSKANQFLSESKAKYSQIRNQLAGRKSKLSSYIPGLDTLRSSLKFLNDNREMLSSSAEVNKKLSTATENISDLEGSFAEAEAIKSFLKERKREISSYIAGLPFERELKKINKEVYYYSAQVKEYKELLKDKKKVERKAIEILVKSKPFKDFMRKNSQLASMFRLPGGDEQETIASLAGLQTRADINTMIRERLESGGEGAQARFRENVQAAQSELTRLKLKTPSFSSGESNIDIPEGFKPNSQKTKSFFNRLEVGGNIQNQKAKYFFPVTSDLALNLGYRLNDHGVVGLGTSYKLGLGTGWGNLKLSHQGIGFRSYLDYKIKGNFYVSGGYEQNYKSEIRTIQELNHYSAWQTSGLIGITKKYNLNKKLKGNIQLLWDFLSYQQIPRPQPILFRIGYSIK